MCEDQKILIKNFVFNNMDEYELKRDYEHYLGFKTYNSFKKKNNQMMILFGY